VGDRRVEQLLRRPNAISRPVDAAGIETLHGDGEAFAFPAEAIFPQHGQVLEDDLRMKGAAGHRDHLADAEPGAPRSTTKAEIFDLAPPSGRAAKIVNRSATGALVM
jgi:hypothetical protein